MLWKCLNVYIFEFHWLDCKAVLGYGFMKCDILVDLCFGTDSMHCMCIYLGDSFWNAIRLSICAHALIRRRCLISLQHFWRFLSWLQSNYGLWIKDVNISVGLFLVMLPCMCIDLDEIYWTGIFVTMDLTILVQLHSNLGSREKERYLTRSYDETIITNKKFNNQLTTQRRHQQLRLLVTIADRLRTVSWVTKVI